MLEIINSTVRSYFKTAKIAIFSNLFCFHISLPPYCDTPFFSTFA